MSDLEPEPSWPESACDRIRTLQAEQGTLTKLNQGQADEIRTLREANAALVGALNSAARERHRLYAVGGMHPHALPNVRFVEFEDCTAGRCVEARSVLDKVKDGTR